MLVEESQRGVCYIFAKTFLYMELQKHLVLVPFGEISRATNWRGSLFGQRRKREANLFLKRGFIYLTMEVV